MNSYHRVKNKKIKEKVGKKECFLKDIQSFTLNVTNLKSNEFKQSNTNIELLFYKF